MPTVKVFVVILCDVSQVTVAPRPREHKLVSITKTSDIVKGKWHNVTEAVCWWIIIYSYKSTGLFISTITVNTIQTHLKLNCIYLHNSSRYLIERIRRNKLTMTSRSICPTGNVLLNGFAHFYQSRPQFFKGWKNLFLRQEEAIVTLVR